MRLNDWVKDVHFNLDTLKDVPKVVQKGTFFTSIDDKSGFDNVRLSKHNLIGFQWAGYYFRCLTLAFGFKLSSYVYHCLNLQPTSYIRKRFGIPIFLYIDDRLIEEARMLRLDSEAFACILFVSPCALGLLHKFVKINVHSIADSGILGFHSRQCESLF